jgi:carbon monoxide dehydrogenase subunit G
MDTQRPRYWLTAVMLAFALAWIASAPGRAASPPDMDVQVEKVGDEIRAYATFFVRAPRQRVWDVLVDYDRAPEYMPDLEVSRIIARTPDTLRVKQKTRVRFGPFSFPVESVRDIRLTEPVRAESHLVSGSMKSYSAVTELVPEPGGTRVVYRSRAVAGSVLASFAGESFIKHETEEHFTLLRDEILRREHVASRQ